MQADGSSTRLLIRHFIRRFVDNDLLSAHVDRHESLGFFVAGLIAVGIFGAVLLGQKYIAGLPPGGWLALMTMQDKFLMIVLSMIVVSLTAAAQWDALAVDARDAAILGPLPVPHRTILHAKAAANIIFAAGLVAAVTVAPSAIFSLFSLSSVPLAFVAAIRVLLAHMVAAILAAVFAFAAVAAFREILRLICGAGIFARVSVAAQSVLIVMLTTALLLAVGETPSVYSTWLLPEPGERVSPFAVPPMWFLGVAEVLNGHVLVQVPVRGIVLDDDFSRVYIANQALFGRLALTGVIATAGTLLVSGLAYVWNSRRLPAPLPRRQSRRRGSRLLAALAIRSVARNPVTQSGFFFTLRVLFRSGPQRLALAVGVAVALSLTIAHVGSAGLRSGRDLDGLPLSAWALQTFALIALLTAFRHALAVPAELRANWVFHQCWPGKLREYLVGVERAALLAVVAPAVLALAPIHMVIFGGGAALFHAVNGIGLSMALLASIVSTRHVPPFVSSYVRSGNVKSLGPIFVMGVLIFAFSTAAIERAAFASLPAMVMHSCAWFGVAGAIHVVSGWRAKEAVVIGTDAPEPAAQTLGLSG